MVWVEPQTGEEYSIRRINLDKAVAYLKQGGTLAGPLDYKNKIADDRPSYAWAILRHLGYLEERIEWTKVEKLAQYESRLRTKQGEPFHVVGCSDTMVWIEPQTGGKYSVSRTHLDEAVAYLKRGGTLAGPGDYKNKIADDRPSYAWAILRHLGYL